MGTPHITSSDYFSIENLFYNFMNFRKYFQKLLVWVNYQSCGMGISLCSNSSSNFGYWIYDLQKLYNELQPDKNYFIAEKYILRSSIH